MSVIRPVLASLSTLAVVSLATVAPPAGAVTPERFEFDETEALDFDLCGDPDLAVTGTSREYGSGTVRTLARDGQQYYVVKWDGHVSLTRTATGKSVTLNADFMDKDARVTDNGDGTITILASTFVKELDYAPDGSLAFRTVKRETFQVVIDLHSPTDPEDDEEVSSEFFGSTGLDPRADVDFCAWFADVTS